MNFLLSITKAILIGSLFQVLLGVCVRSANNRPVVHNLGRHVRRGLRGGRLPHSLHPQDGLAHSGHLVHHARSRLPVPLDAELAQDGSVRASHAVRFLRVGLGPDHDDPGGRAVLGQRRLCLRKQSLLHEPVLHDRVRLLEPVVRVSKDLHLHRIRPSRNHKSHRSGLRTYTRAQIQSGHHERQARG
jgi:hypothetical protein